MNQYIIDLRLNQIPASVPGALEISHLEYLISFPISLKLFFYVLGSDLDGEFYSEWDFVNSEYNILIQYDTYYKNI